MGCGVAFGQLQPLHKQETEGSGEGRGERERGRERVREGEKVYSNCSQVYL